MAKQTYIFKPLKAITTWTLILAGLKAVSLGVYVLCNLVSAVTGQPLDYELMADTLSVVAGFSASAYSIMAIVSTVVTLIWFYGAARNTMAMRQTLDLSPPWAVGWWFIPFANLYKPYQYMRDIWQTAMMSVDRRYSRTALPVVWWWWIFLAGNVLFNISDRVPDMMAEAWLVVIGGGLTIVATVLFLRLVQQVSKQQVNADTRIADQF